MTAPHDRVPPGQTVTAEWPVLTYGDTPRVDPSRWRPQPSSRCAPVRRETRRTEPMTPAPNRVPPGQTVTAKWPGTHVRRGDPWLEERFGGRPRETIQAVPARKARE